MFLALYSFSIAYSCKICYVCRVTLLDIMIAKVMAEEPLARDEVPLFLSHAQLFASTFVDQCKIVLKLTSEQHADDEVRGRVHI